MIKPLMLLIMLVALLKGISETQLKQDRITQKKNLKELLGKLLKKEKYNELPLAVHYTGYL